MTSLDRAFSRVLRADPTRTTVSVDRSFDNASYAAISCEQHANGRQAFSNRPIDLSDLDGGRTPFEQRHQAGRDLVGFLRLIPQVEPVDSHIGAFDGATHLKVHLVEQQHGGAGCTRRP